MDKPKFKIIFIINILNIFLVEPTSVTINSDHSIYLFSLKDFHTEGQVYI